MSQVQSQPGELRRNALGFTEVLITGLSQIAPAFGVMFTAAVIAANVGPAVPSVYLLAVVGILATAITLAQFSRIWPSSGSFVTYISRAIGPRTGLGIAIIALLGYIVGNGGVFVYVGSYIVTELFHTTGTGLTLVLTVIYAIIVTIPVIVGVRVGVRAAVVMYAFEVSVILALTIAILVQGGADGLNAQPLSFNFPSAKGLGLAFALGILAFVGFEAPAPLGEESRNPRRIVPLAIVSGVLITAALYVVSSYAVVEAFPSASALASDPAPFITASNRFISPLAGIVTWLFLTSVTGSYLGANTALARIVFSGAREGLWDRRLATVHRRFRTPWVAVLACVVPGVVVGVVVALASGVATATGFVPTLGILGITTMFVAANAALIVFWFRERARGVRRSAVGCVVVPAIGVVALAAPFYSDFQPGQVAPYSYLPWFYLALVAIGVLYVVYLQRTKPAMIAQAGSIIMGESSPVDRAQVRTADEPAETS
ncbi:MAG TPA: APC family permease [Streptosporangiaceae bacterium]|jgi:amino acid transporter